MQPSQEHACGRVDGQISPQSSQQHEQRGIQLLPPAPAPYTTKNSFLLRLDSPGDTLAGKDGDGHAAALQQPRKDPDGTAHSAIIITTPSDSSSSSSDGSGSVSIHDVLSRKRKYAIIYISAVAAILAPLSPTSESICGLLYVARGSCACHLHTYYYCSERKYTKSAARPV
jgi:hypothetical protein